jgi:hypothetical protein
MRLTAHIPSFSVRNHLGTRFYSDAWLSELSKGAELTVGL